MNSAGMSLFVSKSSLKAGADFPASRKVSRAPLIPASPSTFLLQSFEQTKEEEEEENEVEEEKRNEAEDEEVEEMWMVGAILSPPSLVDMWADPVLEAGSIRRRKKRTESKQLETDALIPTSFDLSDKVPGLPFDQKDDPTCVAVVLAAAMGCLQFLEKLRTTGSADLDDPRFQINPYSIYNSREEPKKNEGMTVRSGGEVLRHKGCNNWEDYPETRVWPQDFMTADELNYYESNGIEIPPLPYTQEDFDTLRVSKELKRQLLVWKQKASENRIVSFARVFSLQHTKECLVRYGPMPIIIRIYDSSMEMYKPHGKKRRSLGAHCVLLTGYDDQTQRLRIRNSWGADWGDQGHFYIPYEDFRQYVLEAWVLVDGVFVNEYEELLKQETPPPVQEKVFEQQAAAPKQVLFSQLSIIRKILETNQDSKESGLHKLYRKWSKKLFQ